MKKVYLNEMDQEKRDKLIKKNSKLMNQLQSDLYEAQMDWQYYDADAIMNKEAQKAIEYHDNYSSFFYTLTDWRKFIVNIDSGYLSDDAKKIYDHIMKKLETLDNMEYYSDNYYNLEEHLEKETEKVLDDVEGYLHSYEKYPEEDDAIQYADEMDQLEGYYIEEREDGSSDGVIRKDVSYTECYI